MVTLVLYVLCRMVHKSEIFLAINGVKQGDVFSRVIFTMLSS